MLMVGRYSSLPVPTAVEIKNGREKEVSPTYNIMTKSPWNKISGIK